LSRAVFAGVSFAIDYLCRSLCPITGIVPANLLMKP